MQPLNSLKLIPNAFVAESAFEGELREYRHRADQFAFGTCLFLLVVSTAVAPVFNTWDALILVALPTTALSWFVSRRRAGALSSRVFMSLAFMVFTGLIIHQLRGDIEAHFVAFGLVGVLLYYRDWRTIFTATVAIYLHHLVLGLAQKQGLPVFVFDSDRFWLLFGTHLLYFLPFVLMMGYLSVWLRRDGILQIRSVAAYQARAKELDMLNAELEAFAYSVAHDLRTPLRSIQGFASVLLEEDAQRLDDSGRSHLLRIQGGANRMGQLITDLLSMTQLGRAAMKLEPVDLSAVAKDIANELQRSDPERRVRWTIEDKLVAKADPMLVRAVLQNLLGNAWKYTGKTPEPRISLELASSASGLNTFAVRDNGIGFDMAFAQQLFKPFSRLHALHEFEGSGVGLANVKRIVERHGGEVSAEGVPGEGAVFRFSLPLMQG